MNKKSDEPPTVKLYERFKKVMSKFSIAEIVAIIFSFIGIVLILLFLIKYWNGNKLNDQAQLGDLIGGVVGSLWAFAGILLFYSALRLQKNEFKLQRKEFRMQRIEFVLNRITQIVYKQKELIDASYSNKDFVLSTDDFGVIKGRECIDFIINQMEIFKHDVDYDKLEKGKKEKMQLGYNFLYKPEVEELIYTLYSSLKLIEDYIEDKYVNENSGEEFVLSEDNKRHLYRLASSTWNFNEMNKVLFALKSYKFFCEQNKVFGGLLYDKVMRLSSMLDFSLECIKRIKQTKLFEVDTFARRESIISKNGGRKRVLYTG